jgi:hypothetical protein
LEAEKGNPRGIPRNSPGMHNLVTNGGLLTIAKNVQQNNVIDSKSFAKIGKFCAKAEIQACAIKLCEWTKIG